MVQDLFKLNNQLQETSEKISHTENQKRNVERINEDLQTIFFQNKRLFADLKDIWRTGEMNLMVYDIDLELKNHQRKVFDTLHEEISELNSRLKTLEEKEDYILAKRKTL